MKLVNLKPIQERIPKTRQGRLAMAVSAGIDERTLKRISDGDENISLRSLAGIIKATDAPYEEVFSPSFYRASLPAKVEAIGN